MHKDVQLHRVRSASFAAAIEEKLMDDLARAKRDFLLCKAASMRRKKEMAVMRREGKDTSKLERMIEFLEATRDANWDLITRLEGK